MSCQLTGAFAHWTLTAAQDGTFVDLEMGMEPTRLRYRLMDATIGQRVLPQVERGVARRAARSGPRTGCLRLA